MRYDKNTSYKRNIWMIQVPYVWPLSPHAADWKAVEEKKSLKSYDFYETRISVSYIFEVKCRIFLEILFRNSWGC